MALKRQRIEQLEQEESLENVTITSARLNRIQQRINALGHLPEGANVKVVRDTLKKLNSWKALKPVQKLLREYTDGGKADLDNSNFVSQLVMDSEALNLLNSDEIQAISLRVSLSALLMRV